MRVNKIIAGAVIAAIISLQAWTLTAIVDLKVQVAEVKTQMLALSSKTQIANERHHSNPVTLNP